ncbi:midasin [Iris pallida]|uniref:Midasin n=1 Tax=Iris pallida TaxID=29817 RepID=A0AAX6EVV8_IRIPA|nr:midasin [Iris pallida]
MLHPTQQTPIDHDIHDDDVAIPVVPTNNVGSPTKGKKYVMLLSQNLKEEVAKGYLAAHTRHRECCLGEGDNRSESTDFWSIKWQLKTL